ncbi:uncharacterized protein LOC107634023 [Arachis ipaensis]|uniref:uncharacterized protein LOC107634023 n=1 Tax=Arachis ipaensis TaxID=130454 RepID=UPI000A2B1467|nr:uncharacterized protein LOC107634023 [Arachis ipaensis]
MVGMKKVSVHMRKGAKTGERKKGKGRYDEVDNDEDHVLPQRAFAPFRAPMTTFSCLMQHLEHKKASFREEGLAAFIKIFNEGNQDSILEKCFVTYLYQVLNCLKKGLTKEKQLASQALGLMAITAFETDNAEEIYVYTISLVTELVQTPNKALKNQAYAANLSKLIYAWLFLLTKVDSWEIIYGHWQGAICQFLSLLKEDATCVVAGEALALIFDCDKIDKFFVKTEELLLESYDGLRKYIKDIILKQLESTSLEAKTALPLKQMFNNAARAYWDVLMYIVVCFSFL